VSTPQETGSGTTAGKGRPTPSRKQAEAAAKARAKTPRTRKEINARTRTERAANSAKVREAMKTGDDRYLPARDKGPVKRFVRDWVDCRFTIVELVLPVLIVAMAFSYTRSKSLAIAGELVVLLLVLSVILSLAFYRAALFREIRKRFPGQSTKGLTYYMGMRMVQVRFLRMPKPQLKVGEKLPDNYR
jgi:hypothetical protein